MKTARLSRRLGLDGNPLRRRTDKIAACAAALLLAVFLIGAPLLSVAAAGWAARSGSPTCRPVVPGARFPPRCCRRRRRPLPPTGFSASLVLARWTAPDGRVRTGHIPVSARMAAGSTVRLWVDAAGSQADPPLNHRQVEALEATAAAIATATLGIMLLCLAWAGRRVLDWRRLAAWEAAWAVLGPQWTRRFRSRG